MKKVVVKYYSLLNLGDDLFIILLAKKFPNVSFRLIGNPLYIFKIKGRPKNLKPQYIKNLLLTSSGFLSCRFPVLEKFYNRFEKALKSHADVFLQIGGSIFMETSKKEYSDYLNPKEEVSFENAMQDRKSKLNKAFIDNKSSIIMGANIGPVYTESYLQYTREIISNCSFVCVRDLYSYAFCRDLDNVVYAPDIIFNLKYENTNFKNEDRKSIVFSIINAKDKPELKLQAEKYFKFIANAIDELSTEYNIELVSFCEREGDMEGIREIYNQLSCSCNQSNIRLHKYNGNVEEIINIFKNCDYVVASRFHSMILGLLFNKPIFPICYGAKMIHYLNDVEFNGKIGTPKNLDQLNTDDLLSNLRNNYICDCKEHEENAYLQFEVLSKLLYE